MISVLTKQHTSKPHYSTHEDDDDEDIIYPDSDGKPMADNTKQFDLIVLIKLGLEALFADKPDVFIAGNLLWYPEKGNNRLAIAPDVLVAFGRPKGYRGSYMQWKEENITPQVVFEVLSPSNTMKEMLEKLDHCEQMGVEEFYICDPDTCHWLGWVRPENNSAGAIEPVRTMTQHRSPRLGIGFGADPATEDIWCTLPDGSRFASFVELKYRLEAEQQLVAEERARAAEERARAAEERARAEREYARAEHEQQRAEHLAEQLRKLGIEPEA
jgi:Uma2 family endonuclease